MVWCSRIMTPWFKPVFISCRSEIRPVRRLQIGVARIFVCRVFPKGSVKSYRRQTGQLLFDLIAAESFSQLNWKAGPVRGLPRGDAAGRTEACCSGALGAYIIIINICYEMHPHHATDNPSARRCSLEGRLRAGAVLVVGKANTYWPFEFAYDQSGRKSLTSWTMSF